MKILNYKWYTFTIIEAEDFFVAYFNFIDYNLKFREVCITKQNIWRDVVYLARFSWYTTEYTWNIEAVLDKVIEWYKNNEIKNNF